jgi:hypothetical protein
MALITRKEFEELANVQRPFSISIFIPTHRAGMETIEQQDRLVFKNQLREVEGKLEARGLKERDISILLKPAVDLLNDTGFWRRQSDGLAVFLAKDYFQYHTLPVHFESFNYLSNEFYLKPLMPLFTGNGRFFLLALELQDLKFFECTRYSVTEINVKDLTPERLEEVVGYDYRQKFLQSRSQAGGQAGAIFHGHGEGKDERKNEIQRFFRAIDKGLMKILHDEDPPMIFVGQEYLFGIYKEINSYKNLFEKFIPVNPHDKDVLWLHERAWELLQPSFEEEKTAKIEQFGQFHDTSRTSFDIAEVVPAAISGRIDTLFVRNRSDIWGVYNLSENAVIVEETPTATNLSLLNLAAVQTFLNGGKVYLMEEEEMPVPVSEVNALFRY